MPETFHRWILEMKLKGVISEFRVGGRVAHRLRSPVIFRLSDEKIRELKTSYDPNIEKGGLMLFRPENDNNGTRCCLEKIIFLKNISSDPSSEYLPDNDTLRKEMIIAFRNQLLPSIFHSHPTGRSHVLLEYAEYYRQMDTSLQDQQACACTLFPDSLNLQLPELLVISNGRLKTGLFVGVYGGGIAPTDFSERKKVLTDRFVEVVRRQSDEFFSTSKGIIVGATCMIGLIYFGIRYPKTAISIGATAAAVLPSIIYETPRHQEFFGISHGAALDVFIPKRD